MTFNPVCMRLLVPLEYYNAKGHTVVAYPGSGNAVYGSVTSVFSHGFKAMKGI